MVRSQLASSGQRWEADDALPILARLVRHDEDLGDPHIPNLLWWAFERQLRQDRDAVVELLCTSRDAAAAAGRDGAAGAGGAGAGVRGFGRRLRGLRPAAGRRARQGCRRRGSWTGMEQGLEGRTLARTPGADGGTAVAALGRGAAGAGRVDLIRLAARMGSPAAVAAAVDQARDPRAAGSDRIADDRAARPARAGRRPVRLLVETPRTATPSATIQLAAVGALGGYAQPATARPLLERYRSASAGRPRPDPGLALHPPAVGRRVAGRDRAPADRRQGPEPGARPARSPSFPTRRCWPGWKPPGARSRGRVRPRRRQRIAEIRGLLPEGDKGNAARGKPIFKENCAVCHKLFGEGESIGPDLTGAERGDLDFLMTSLVDPSALVRKEYQSQTIALRDGRVLTGLVVDENDRTLTLVDSNRQKTIIARDAVEEAKPSDVSLMPEGLLDKLTEPQIRDLFRYIQSSGVR